MLGASGTESARRRTSWRGALAIVAFAAFGGPVVPAHAQCLLTDGNTVATCTGNQSGGVVFVDTSVGTVHLQNLTTQITPAAGTAAVELRRTDPSPPPQLTVTADGTVIASVTDAPAIEVAGTGTAGGAGQPGGTGHAINVTVGAGGTLTATNTSVVNTRAAEFNRQTELDDANDRIPLLTRELSIREFLLSQTVEPVDSNEITSNTKREEIAQALIDAGHPAVPGVFDPAAGITQFEQNDIGAILAPDELLRMDLSRDQATVEYLSNPPLPQEVPDRMVGAVDARSTGGNGGAGNAGGAGGAIVVTANGAIVTSGVYNPGIHAVSRGGNGGTGGNPGGAGSAVTVTANGNITTTGIGSAAISAHSVGGDGSADTSPGTGGAGGTVEVASSGSLTTSAYGSYGIFARSIGGTGGNASSGDNMGATGGVGGNVAVTMTGDIVTAGAFGYGIFATSQGGNGGNGSGNESGGTGGAAGNVAVTIGSSIATSGDFAHGILAQSLGGTGGLGGNVVDLWAEAGGGGNAGRAGTVTVTTGGTVTTAGDFAYGVLAQSLGGSGGAGGVAVGLVSFGGVGGGGASADTVTLTNTATIVTSGQGSHAILTQSVGGGGGDAGFAGGLVALGGTGGTAAEGRCALGALNRDDCNDGGAVTVTSSGRISTAGDLASGIIAQSIGGGGGAGGNSFGIFSFGGSGGAGGDGDTVTVTNTGMMTTAGDLSAAIVAQSIGGGGGHGGDSTAIGLFRSVAIGGTGGSGGHGDTVQVSNSGLLITSGGRSSAIVAQSIGGGGGAGGAAVSISVGVVAAVAVAVGGSGGSGGDGSSVTVNNTGTILTAGQDSRGVFAQSVGGGGGAGGSSLAAALAVAPPNLPSIAVAVSVGGSGGDGGAGSDVTVTNSGTIITQGDGSTAVMAQSIGGGGGTGGDSSAMAAAIGGKVSASISVAVGGSGGAGNVSGAVVVSNSGVLITAGDLAHGVFAQSVGGGGGDGGFGYSQALSPGEGQGTKVGVAVTVGGSGGIGNIGGDVTVTNSGAITTLGDGARGIFAQSVGGGGGSAGGGDQASEDREASAEAIAQGKKALDVAIGGSGGLAGIGGGVTVNNIGSIFTAGNDADGIFAQSVGGGGGLGGSVSGSSESQENPNKKSYSVSVAIGGSGGGSGDGNDVTVTNSGTIVTAGDNSRGIFAQSVGGGGGLGGSGESSSADASYSFSFTLGGSGGTAGNGGRVEVGNNGSILTMGFESHAIFAQSIGGGGGVGGGARSSAESGNEDTEKGALALGIGGSGGAAGNGGVVVVNNSGNLDTFGTFAFGILAQSVGGGGGTGGGGGAEAAGEMNIGGGFGGGGGSSGDGGMVTVTNSGRIATRGHDAIAIAAQSVGGGGGIGGTGSGDGGGTKSVGISVGGQGGSSGIGGDVAVAQTGDIITLGNRAYGILAQSIGGGGGLGGSGEGGNGGSIAVGGDGAGGGNGGMVTVNLTGNIRTFGETAHAILAQSVGGGGGIGGEMTGETFNVGVGVGGSGGAAGNGGTIEIDSNGTIVTTGMRAYGILAQSIGGGGGLGGEVGGGLGTASFAGSNGGTGTGGTITINHTGDIFALGEDSHAIFAQSSGGTGAGNIAVNILGSTIVGGSGDGAGIFIDGGNDNEVNLKPAASVSALSGLAIRGGAGNDTVNNEGVVSGDVLLGGGANAFNNLATGRFYAGSTVNLGAGNALNNAGTFDAGGPGAIATTALTGNFVQSAAGTLAIDVRFDPAQPAADRLNVTGNTVLDGLVRANNLYLMPNVAAITVLTTTGTFTDNGVAALYTPAITYGLNVVGGVMTLSVADVHFAAPPGLTGQQSALGQHFQNIWNAGGAPAMAETMGYLSNLGAAGYAAALDKLHPEPQLTQATASTMAGMNFVNAIMSCQGADGPYAALRERECNWARITGGVATQGRTSGTLGYRDGYVRIQAGRQVRLAPDWLLGLGLGYERGRTDVADSAITNADRYSFGATLKHEAGPWLLAGALGLGYASLDNRRTIGFPTPGLVATSRSEVWNANVRLRAAYLLEAGPAYFKPMVDFDVIYTHMPAFNETGAGALNLRVSGLSDVVAAVTPAIEAGVSLKGDSVMLRPYASLGMTFLSKGSRSVSSTFEGTPPGVGPFVTATRFPDAIGRVSAGLDLLNVKPIGGTDVRVQYDGQFSDNYSNHTGSMKFSLRF